MKYLKSIKIVVFVLLSLFFSLNGCKKLDISQESNSKDLNKIEEMFFTKYKTNDPLENKILNYIKRQNDKFNFIEKTIDRIGYPRWDKQLLKSKSGSTSFQNSLTGDSTNIFYIPFVRDSQNYVNASMIINANLNDTTISYVQDWQYQSKQNSINSNIDSAENYAIFFMRIDQIVFGYNSFSILDSNLFKFQNNNISHVSLDSNSNSLNAPSDCQTTTIRWQIPCPVPLNGNTNNNNSLSMPLHCYSSVVISYCPEIDFGGFTLIPVPLPTYGTSGGGGGTGGGVNTNIGWQPFPIQQPDLPCDPYINVLKTDAYFTSMFKYLQNPNTIGLTVETGFSVDRAVTPYVQQTGTDQLNPWINWNIPPGTKIDGLLHAHNCPINGNQCAATIFSPADLVFMARIYLNGFAKDTNNLFFGVANNDLPYIIKVTNTAKFRTFAQAIAGDTKKTDKFINKYDPLFSSSSSGTNEYNFLQMLKDYGVDNGLTLYRGTSNDCNDWVKLKKGNFNNAVEEPCE